MRKLQHNDEGLSLIEVLIAVVILAIVATPFLHSFVTTANTNSKAKQAHKVTVLAQSVMEACKAENMDAIARQFDYPKTGFRMVEQSHIGDGNDVSAFVRELRLKTAQDAEGNPIEEYKTVVPYETAVGDTPEEKKAAVTASIYSENMGEDYEFLGQDDGVYYFAMDQVTQDTTDYDVLIQLNAAPYRHTEGEASSGKKEYNAQELVQIPVIDLKQDAVCIQKEDYAKSAVEEFLTYYQNPNNPDSIRQVRDGIKSTITVTVDQWGQGSAQKTRVITEYKYTYVYNGSTKEYVKSFTSFDSTETGADLRSVYLYYSPLYGNGGARDQIIFRNEKNVPLDFYLFKQTKSDGTAIDEKSPYLPATAERENNYKVKVEIVEQGTNKDTLKTNLHTNLNRNFQNDGVSEYANREIYLNNSKVKLEDIGASSLLDVATEDRLFDIEVKVYKSGAAAAGYPDGMKLTTMSGSKISE